MLLAGMVLLPEHQFEPAHPPPVVRAEQRVLHSVRMLLLVHMPEQLQRDAGSSLRPCSFRCTTVHSGNGRGTLAAGPTGKSRFSSSESVRSSASGQVIPAAAALVT
jgi:hypothetical protein